MSERLVGIGTDLVEVARIREAMRHPRFARRIFTERERELIGADPLRAAGRWAAKEAVAKALRLAGSLSWQDVEVLNAPDGAPVVGLPERLSDVRVMLSISHERGYALAMVVATSLESA